MVYQVIYHPIVFGLKSYLLFTRSIESFQDQLNSLDNRLSTHINTTNKKLVDLDLKEYLPGKISTCICI